MENREKRLAKNTALLFFRSFFVMGLGLFTSRLVLSILGVDDFGTYNVVGSLVTSFSLISGTLSFTSQRFIAYELGKKEDSNPQIVFSSSLKIHVILCAVVFLLAESIGLFVINRFLNFSVERLFAVNVVYQLSLGTFILSIISVPYSSLITAHEKMNIFSYASIGESFLKLVSVILISHLSCDKMIAYACSLFGIALILRMFYVWYCKHHFSEARYKSTKSNKYLKEILSFSGWDFLASIACVARIQGVNLLFNVFFGVRVNAARGITAQVETASNSFVNNFLSALRPQIIKAYSGHDWVYLNKLIFKGTKISCFLLSLICVPVFFKTEDILVFWLRNVPDYTVTFVRLVLIFLMTECLGNAVMTTIFASGKIKLFEVISFLLQVIVFPISYVLFKMGCPPEYSYVVMIGTSIVNTASKTIILSKIIKFELMRFYTTVYLRIFATLLLSCILLWFSYDYFAPSLWGIAFFVTMSTVIQLFFSLTLGLSGEERKSVIEKVKLKLHKG